MSNRFVSGGTIGFGGESSESDAAAAQTQQEPLQPLARNAEWEAVQKELEAERKHREQARLKASTEGEKSLYDILQANKAAKQAEYEEKNKIKNQFRALDDDEISFLDDVRVRRKKEEDAVRQETEEGLKAFRAQQQGDHALPPLDDLADEEWGVGRKRRRPAAAGSGRQGDGTIKAARRKLSGGADADGKAEKASVKVVAEKVECKPDAASDEGITSVSTRKASTTLVDYGSDSDGD
ncbi:hypothetical protein DCS_07404 [Drechmeria coniospora]|uniref:FAM192A/Fyv6 N-terminal domain-containing protein n=1 Tax=Drechmeria coniospora TaxID=98403 RepID=A0A151GEE2_DRECN|nr:hypothetical protein DCS_07404 [Drechmeria coniospora]KYK55441.1 hypothetical protein DCS_07404 [Drechmeria coniospora]ODA81952.1 hypothetical protein RJ55_00457 [Drechmeria coniospora]